MGTHLIGYYMVTVATVLLLEDHALSFGTKRLQVARLIGEERYTKCFQLLTDVLGDKNGRVLIKNRFAKRTNEQCDEIAITPPIQEGGFT